MRNWWRRWQEREDAFRAGIARLDRLRQKQRLSTQAAQQALDEMLEIAGSVPAAARLWNEIMWADAIGCRTGRKFLKHVRLLVELGESGLILGTSEPVEPLDVASMSNEEIDERIRELTQ